MNERQKQFRVGIVVFATMIIGGLLASLSGPLPRGWLPWRTQYQVGIAVPEAPGVDKNTPVRKNGILIGRVKSIEDKEGGVLLTLNIDNNRPLYPDFEPHIRTTVLGDATIDFQSRRPAPNEQQVEAGYVFKGRVDPNPFDSLGQLGDLKNEFSAASRSLTQAGDEVAKLASRVNNAFGEDSGPGSQGRMTRMLDTTERAMNQFAQTMQSINEIIGDEPIAGTQPGIGPQPGTYPPGTVPPGTVPPANGQQMRRKIRQSLDELPDAIHDLRLTMQDSRRVLASAEKNFKNLEAFTEPLGQKGPDVAESILKAVDGLDQLVRDLGEVARALNNRDGTVGKLIHDPQVYENLNRLMFNVNSVLDNINQLTFDVKPVIYNARVFMDKVATEPGRIISGGVNPSVIK